MRHIFVVASFGLAAAAAAPSRAQRVNDNAVAQAEDAFGINVSGENLGLYDPGNVRGFSPTVAGNVRFDGLYVDKVGNTTSRLVRGSRILVGASVLGHPFPAPSGIVDYQLRKPDNNVLSIAGDLDDYGGRFLEMDGQVRQLLPGLGLAGGLGFYRYSQWYGGRSHVFSTALAGRWKPAPPIEITPFWSRIHDARDEALPMLLLDGAPPPRHGHARRFVGQHWAKAKEISYNEGVLSNLALGSWQLRAGIFRSVDHIPINYTPLFVLHAEGEDADRSMIAERNQSGSATSGEVMLARTIPDGKRQHRIVLAAWGRDHRRAYGASDEAYLSPGPVDFPVYVPAPDFHFGPQTRDRVRQITAGLTYDLTWRGVGVLNLGIEKSNYEKKVVQSSGALPVSHAHPWLFSASAAIELSPSLALYSGISRGLEESPVAPAVATNRNEAPPAIRTKQIDAGLRWSILPHLNLVAGGFRIDKPYYGLDDERYFRNLGRIRHQGFELSLAGSPVQGLSIVGGAVRLDATVSGENVASGKVGHRPVGSSPLTLIASADYRLPRWPRLSIDANVERDGRQIVSVDDRTRLPSRALLDVGFRYRLNLFAKPSLLRVQVLNVTNQFGWDVIGSNALQVHQPRQAYAKLTIDF